MLFSNGFWKKKTFLEIGRFCMYLTVPLFASAIYANPQVMKELILRLNYVQYPKAGAGLSPEELEKIRQDVKDDINRNNSA